jgi:4'-phosphopantetheinyl transferase
MPPQITLGKEDIHLWIIDPTRIREPLLLARYRSLLSDDECNRVDRYKFAEHRHDALITRAFVRDLLSRYADRQPRDWRFDKGEKDKPEIVDPPLPLRFNLSHTKGMIICAVCLEHDIGADVEFIERNSDVLSIADRFFSPDEVSELFSLDSDEAKRSRFFDYWTLKESYIKAWGLGLAIPLDHFSFHIGKTDCALSNHNIGLSFVPQRKDNPEDWQSWLFYPGGKHRMAVSIRMNKSKKFNFSFYSSTPLLHHYSIHLPLE